MGTYVRHANEGAFEPVEPGIFVRDLGIGDLTAGELTAQVVRIEPEGAYVENLHRHDEGFSLAYVLKGWLDVEFEEIGVQHLGPGTVIPAFNGPMHRELRLRRSRLRRRRRRTAREGRPRLPAADRSPCGRGAQR